MRSLLLILFLLSANHAMAWWNTPYNYAPQRGSYWPSVWPAYIQPQRHFSPYANYGTGWNVKGSMSESGNIYFVMEYRGNIYDDFYGRNYRQPFYNGYQMNPNYWRGWR